ncbi:casein kinase 2 regulatory subunit [Lobulomyces angularis]|nr:casein kinase 2 regulatory subunit [Lobulomyces angularis]
MKVNQQQSKQSSTNSQDHFRSGINNEANVDNNLTNNSEAEESDDDENSDSYLSNSGTSGSSVISWISWFCSIPGHEFFAEVPEDFVEDDFNLTGLNAMVPMFNEALDTILDLELEVQPDQDEMQMIEESAELLYGMIHQRYIVTKQGLEVMANKFEHGAFGVCPRYLCGKCNVVPVGRSDKLGSETVKLFCARCLDVYTPKEQKHLNIDGAFFGTTFAHLFFLTYPGLTPRILGLGEGHNHSKNKKINKMDSAEDNDDEDDSNEDREKDITLLDDYEIYVPKIFGFKVSELSKAGPRMTWLRVREEMMEENSAMK